MVRNYHFIKLALDHFRPILGFKMLWHKMSTFDIYLLVLEEVIMVLIE
jgi:hypothetical protein